jgi:hypothetical protein
LHHAGQQSDDADSVSEPTDRECRRLDSVERNDKQHGGKPDIQQRDLRQPELADESQRQPEQRRRERRQSKRNHGKWCLRIDLNGDRHQRNGEPTG